MPLLSIRDLRLSLPAGGQRVSPVDGVSFDIEPGECVGLVGESGCGKSLTAMSILGLSRQLPGARLSGTAIWQRDNATIDLLALREAELSRVRGREIAMVFQDPLSALNPLLRVEQQIGEVLVRHHRQRGRVLAGNVESALSRVGVPQPAVRARQYPHQLSGGLRQRVMLAMALAGGPKLLIADEPTTALDVTVQAQILIELKRLKEGAGMGVLFITHDLGVVAQLCDRVLVMYAGRIVESASVEQFFSGPLHPYSRGLLASLPSLALRGEPLYSIPGSPPRPGQFPAGCRFNPRCPLATEQCRREYPPLEHKVEGRLAACWEVPRST